MRQFQIRPLHPQTRPSHGRPSAHAGAQAPARVGPAPHVDDEQTLDRAAALWTTRRIRSFLLLLEQPGHGTRR
ncbi:hypothetical protein [Variovorax sp. Root473]|uniref:hypothetical protein n=1 Tax=Variovorax sp. Root473 TaxID=1736541 RepID=UPI0006FD3121|nr:hypothetical protein [Variovorax sp. Root473]KQX91888.1 hypothetical protein ASD34_24630 [Variovorax sp. Root473]